MRLLDTILERKRWILLSSFFFVLALTIAGYVFYLKFFHPKDKAIILQQFGNLFLTEEQIEKLRNMKEKVRPSSERPDDKQVCSFTCTKRNVYSYSSPRRDRRSVDPRVQENADAVISIHSRSENTRSRASKTRRKQTFDRTQKNNNAASSTSFRNNNNNSNDNNSTATSTDAGNTVINGSGYSSNSSKNNNSNKDDRWTSTSSEEEGNIGRVVLEDGEDEENTWKYHGCCRSRNKVAIPTTLTTIDNVRVRVVQFNSRQQIYFEQICEQMSSCTGCTCYTESRHQVFLVVDDDGVDDTDDNANNLDNARLEMVAVPGCCKCLNEQ